MGEKRVNTGQLVIVRGGGDLATGVVQKLWRCGFPVIVLEVAKPLAIRRTVSISTAIEYGEYQVEDVPAVYAADSEMCQEILSSGKVPVLIDEEGAVIEKLKPAYLIDAIMAKKNLGTSKAMAPFVVALGPGFSAPDEVDVVVETMRGHNLGRLIFQGTALPNTGIPGLIASKSSERVIHAPVSGRISHNKKIGDSVLAGDTLFSIAGQNVTAPISGVLRGLISENVRITEGLKVADIDPRLEEKMNCFTISDKARALGGAVLEAVCMQRKRYG